MVLKVRNEQSGKVRLALRSAFYELGAASSRQAHGGRTVATVIGGNMLSQSPQDLEAEFLASRSLRPQNKSHLVFHVSFSEDGPVSRSDADWATLAARYAAALGFADAAYVVVRRHDPEGTRVHLVAARIDAWGQRIKRPGAAVMVEAAGRCEPPGSR